MSNIISNSNQNFQPPRVLVVDDNAMYRDVIAQTLLPPSYFVDFAKDGFEGLEMALQRSYDVILTDLRMPKMSGAEMIENLRMHPHLLKNCQIAIMSTVPYNVAGVSTYIQKPFKQSELKTLIDKQASNAYNARVRQGRTLLHSLSNVNYGTLRPVSKKVDEQFEPDRSLLQQSTSRRNLPNFRVMLSYKDQVEASRLTDILTYYGFDVQSVKTDLELSSCASQGFHLILVDHLVDESAVWLARARFTPKTWTPVVMVGRSSSSVECADFVLDEPFGSGAFIYALSLMARMQSERHDKLSRHFFWHLIRKFRLFGKISHYLSSLQSVVPDHVNDAADDPAIIHPTQSA